MKKPDGSYTVTVTMSEDEMSLLRLVMEHTYRRTMSDCVRALIAEAGKNFLPDASKSGNAPRTKRAANITIN